MKIQYVTVANLLRPREREESERDEGESIGETLGRLGWTAARVVVNGDQVDEEDYAFQPAGGSVVLVLRCPQGVDPFTIALVNILISIAISVAFAYLFPPPKPAKQRDDQDSPTYGFGGIQSNRVEGLPIAAGWGKMRTGGTIVNEFTDVEGFPPRTTYYALICFGEGPFNSIGGITEDTPSAAPLRGSEIPVDIEINGNPAQNFKGVQVWARMGTNQQDPIPNFDVIRQTFSFDVELTSTISADEDTFAITPGFTINGTAEFDSTNDAVWTTFGQEYDFNDEDVDGFAITFSFPGGLFRQNATTGGSEEAGFGFQVRYRALDAGGSPVTSGGPNGDGYVRLPIEGPFGLRNRTPFEFQFKDNFRDPQTFDIGALGQCADFTPAGSTAISHGLGVAGVNQMPHATGTEIGRLSGSCWVLMDSAIPNTTTDPAILFDMSTAGTGVNRGFRLSLQRRTSGGGTDGVALTLRIGRGSRFIETRSHTVLQSGTPQFSGGGTNGLWVHVGFTYQRNFGIRLFINGNPSNSFGDESPSNIDIEWARVPLLIGGGQSLGRAAIDDVKIYDRTLTTGQMRTEYNNRRGLLGSADPSAGSLVFWADLQTLAVGNSTDRSGAMWWPDGDGAFNNATLGVREGIVRDAVNTELRRGRYRVEVLRVTRSTSSVNVQDTINVATFQSLVSRELSYPNTPLLGIAIESSEQLNGSIPQITSVNEQLPGAIWDGISTVLPNIRTVYTTNPAWVALGFILNERIGLGSNYTSRSVVLPSFLAWAQHCDEIVYDGTRRVTVANPTSDAKDSDLIFTNTYLDPSTGENRGRLDVFIPFETSPILPERFQVGAHLRLAGYPDATAVGVAVDVNSPDLEGYEVFELTSNNGEWKLSCYYDRLDEGDPWLSGTLLGLNVLADTTLLNGATISGASRRFEFNGVFDRRGKAWDSLLDICAVARGAPIPTGSRLNVRFSRARSAVGVITPSNILEGSFQVNYSSPKTRENALSLTISDAEQGFEPVPIAVQAPELESSESTTNIRQGNQSLFGVTDAGQAERHGRYLLNVNRLQKRSGTFGAALDALPYQVGDVLRVSSDVLPRGPSGRVAESTFSTRPAMLQDREDFTGGNWTNVGLTVTANTATDPFGDTIADTVAGVGTLTQPVVPPSKTSGWYTITLFAKPVTTSPSLGITFVTDRGAARGAFVYGSALATSNTTQEIPSAATMQDCGGGWWFLTLSVFVNPPDSGAISTLDIELNPVTVEGSQVSRILCTQSRGPSIENARRAFSLDRDVTITTGTSAKAHIQNSRGDLSSVSLDDTLTPSGVYPAGSLMFTSTEFTSAPVRGNPLIISTTASELLVELSNVSSKNDLSAQFEWVEYVEAVFNDDAVEDIESRGGGTLAERGITATKIPNTPNVGIGQITTVEGATGGFTQEAEVSWAHDPQTSEYVTGSAVFWRILRDADGAWTLGAQVQAGVYEATFALPSLDAGAQVEFSISALSRPQPIGSPSTGLRFGAAVSGSSWKPEPPSSIKIVTSGFEATYTALFATAGVDEVRRPFRVVEFRRGGWICGQVIGRTLEGETSLTVTGDAFLPVGDVAVGRIYARARNRAGGWSDAASLDYTPALPLSAEDPSVFSAAGGTEWEDFYGAGNWVPAAPEPGGATLSASLVDTAGYLEFTGANLTGTYTCAVEGLVPVSTGQTREPRALFLTAAAEAVQVYPVAEADYAFATDSLDAQRWTPEGPLREEPVDGRNVELRIEFRLHDGDTFGPWRSFTPGVYVCVDAQLRLLAERFTTDHNINVTRFHSRIDVPSRSLTEQTSGDLHARNEIL